MTPGQTIALVIVVVLAVLFVVALAMGSVSFS